MKDQTIARITYQAKSGRTIRAHVANPVFHSDWVAGTVTNRFGVKSNRSFCVEATRIYSMRLVGVCESGQELTEIHPQELTVDSFFAEQEKEAKELAEFIATEKNRELRAEVQKQYQEEWENRRRTWRAKTSEEFVWLIDNWEELAGKAADCSDWSYRLFLADDESPDPVVSDIEFQLNYELAAEDSETEFAEWHSDQIQNLCLALGVKELPSHYLEDNFHYCEQYRFEVDDLRSVMAPGRFSELFTDYALPPSLYFATPIWDKDEGNHGSWAKDYPRPPIKIELSIVRRHWRIVNPVGVADKIRDSEDNLCGFPIAVSASQFGDFGGYADLPEESFDLSTPLFESDSVNEVPIKVFAEVFVSGQKEYEVKLGTEFGRILIDDNGDSSLTFGRGVDDYGNCGDSEYDFEYGRELGELAERYFGKSIYHDWVQVEGDYFVIRPHSSQVTLKLGESNFLQIA